MSDNTKKKKSVGFAVVPGGNVVSGSSNSGNNNSDGGVVLPSTVSSGNGGGGGSGGNNGSGSVDPIYSDFDILTGIKSKLPPSLAAKTKARLLGDDDINGKPTSGGGKAAVAIPKRPEEKTTLLKYGEVRASPFGSCLVDNNDADDDKQSQKAEVWHRWRRDNLKPIKFPVENYHHVYGQPVIDGIDQTPLGGGGSVLINNRNKHKLKESQQKKGGGTSTEEAIIPMDIEDDSNTTMNNIVPPEEVLSSSSKEPTKETKQQQQEPGEEEKKEDSATATTTSRTNKNQSKHDFGAAKTPDDAPVGSLRDKWRLLPYFLRLRSLLRQHIDSFDYFVNTEMNDIVLSPSACEIRSDVDPNFYLRYTKCWVGDTPIMQEDSFKTRAATPFQCRLSDYTYKAPIYVNIRYTRGKDIVRRSNVIIGYMPIMLRSSKCILRNCKEHDEFELATKYKECPYDPGGYFIIRGTEKVILIQEQLSKNRVILEHENTHNYVQASITSSTHERKSKSYIFINKYKKIFLKNNTLGDDIPIGIAFKAMGIETDLEMMQLVGSEHFIQNSLALSLEEPAKHEVYTQLQALRWIGIKIKKKTASMSNLTGASSFYLKKRQMMTPEEEARDVLANVILSHIPVVNYDFRHKALYIGHITRRVLLVDLKMLPLDDKDYYGNKRLELAGNLLSLLFEDLFKIFNTFLKKNADNVLGKTNTVQVFDIAKSIRTDTITDGLVHSISSGNWVLKRFRMDRAGITQVLSRLSYMSALGTVTKMNSQFEKTRKVSGPRSLQASQWGMLCPADTPEGEACGLVKSLALLAHITTDDTATGIMTLKRTCFDLGVENVIRFTGNEINSGGTYVVFINGNILGIHVQPHVFVQNLRTMRRHGLVSEFVSIYINANSCAVHIATDGGRVCRPLLIVDETTGCPRLKQHHIESLALGVMTITDLLKEGIVEYVDCNEENNTLIAVTEHDLAIDLVQQRQQGLDPQNDINIDGIKKMKYTHLEIDPFTILGVIGGIIPFPHHNQAPRNTYTVAMAKQAMGTIALNEYVRMDGLIYTLIYPQKPMVKSRILDLLNFDNIPGGHNACIAVMSYSGYDIEDAVILNKASIDRGFGRCMILRKFQTARKRYQNGTMDIISGPPDPGAFRDGKNDRQYKPFSKLDIDGICCVGEKCDPKTILVNKQSPTDTTGQMDLGGGSGSGKTRNIQYSPSPLKYNNSQPAHVDKVLITSNENESHLIKVMTRQIRRPEVGDKFASRHGQKGVCGLIVPQEDLPFNEYGHVPDLIMNPHGFPSRMTVGKLLELLVGKGGLYEGRQGYSSAFGEEYGSADTAESACDALIRAGINYTGKDIFYSGTNGDPLDAYIFSGPVFYQKLKHMVLDKVHARAKGPVAILTRQPTEGRSRDGGLRLGEMERDCLIAYGVSNLLMERLMHSSDEFSTNVCLTCGFLQYQNWCQYCRAGENVATIKLPYACKLLCQELQSMNVVPRLRLKDA